MKTIFAALALGLLSIPAGAGNSDFITPEAGNAVSQNIVVQSEYIWPPQVYVREVEVPADYAIRKLLASEASGDAVTSQGAATSGSGASSGQ